MAAQVIDLQVFKERDMGLQEHLVVNLLFGQEALASLDLLQRRVQVHACP
jgi:hypothetical protein